MNPFHFLRPVYLPTLFYDFSTIITTFMPVKKISILLFILTAITLSGFAQERSASAGSYSPILKFYPNPAISFINFDYNRNFDKAHTLQIFNFLGKKVVELKSPSSRNYLSLEDLYRGIYIFQLRDRQGVVLESGRFQVIK